MSVTYGFYNSLNGDRKYDAKQISAMFDGVITDGVYRSVGNAFAVSLNSGMLLNVEAGRAWFNHTWTLNDTRLVVTIPSAHPVYSRIDAVVIRVDVNNRVNSIVVKSGTAASSPAYPAMTKGPDVYEYPLAYVTVGPSATEISPRNIYQRIGSSECPFVTGVVQGISIDILIKNWKDEFEILFAQLKKQVSQSVAGTVIDKSVTYEKLADDAIRLKFSSISVPASAWKSAAASSCDGIRTYYANVTLSGFTADMFPQVTFWPSAIEAWNLSTIVKSFDGYIQIYAETAPTSGVDIASIVCWR